MIKYLFLLFVLSGCAVGKFPEWPPEVVYQYAILIKDVQPSEQFFSYVENIEEVPQPTEQVSCLKFEILEKIPYKIKFLSVVPTKECNLMGGFDVKSQQLIHNFIYDANEWAKKRTRCFKN